MASDDQSYDAGTARLTIEPKLSDRFEAELATLIAAVPPLPVALAVPDMKKFGDDLDKAWKDADHKLRLDLDPRLTADALKEFENIKIPVGLDLQLAQEQLRDFASLQPVITSKLYLDDMGAREKLEALRAEAERPVTMPVVPESAREPVWSRREPRAAYSQSEPAPISTIGDTSQDFGRITAGLREMVELTKGLDDEQARTVISSRNLIASLDSANALNGNTFLKAMKSQADDAHRAVDDLANAAKIPSTELGMHLSVAADAMSRFSDITGLDAVTGKLHEISAILDEIAKKALLGGGIAGLVGLGGGMLAGLTGIGLAGVLGGHDVMGAFSAQRAVTEEQRDPLAQFKNQEQVRHAAEEQRQAQQGLAESLFKVSDAQTSAKLSSMSLADAYKTVGRQVRDATDALTDAQLAEEGAALGVAGARQHLMQDLMSGTANPLDIQMDVYGIQAAQQRFKESQNKTADQRVDTQETLSRGVSGSPQIIQAVKANADAQHGIVVALQGVENAEVRVSDAALAMHKALMPTEAENKLALAMAKLSPNARDFVTTVHTGLVPAFHSLSQVVQQSLFSGLGESLVHAVDDQLPAMEKGFGAIGGGLNIALKATFSSLDSMFTKLESNGTMKKFVDGINQGLTGLAPLVTGITQGFIEMGAKVGPTVGPLLSSLGSAFAGMAPALGQLGAGFASALTQIAPLLPKLVDALVKSLLPHLPDLVKLVDSFISILTKNSGALGQVADLLLTKFNIALQGISGFLPAIEDVLNVIVPLIAAHPGAFAALWVGWEAVSGVVGLLKGAKAAVDALKFGVELWRAAQSVLNISLDGTKIALAGLGIGLVILAITEMVTHWNDVKEAFDWTYKHVLTPIGHWFSETWHTAVTDFKQGVDDVHNWVVDFAADVENAFDAVVRGFAEVVKGAAGVAEALGHIPGMGWAKSLGKSVSAWADSEIASHPGGHTGTQWNTSATGGPVSGPGGPRDDVIPTMLSNGEFVINADATSRWRPLLEAINAGALNGYQDGGYVDQQVPLPFGILSDTKHTAPPSPVQNAVQHAITPPGQAGVTAPVPGQAGVTAPAPADAQPGSTTSPYTGSTTPGFGATQPNTSQKFGTNPLSGTGGPVDAVHWLQAHLSTPYVWSGTSAAGADCSGIVGDAQQVATGTPDPTGRLGTTMDVLNGTWPSFISGATRDDLFVIGASAEHMVASILGVNVEERQSGETLRLGDAAVSPFSSQFTTVGHLDPSIFVPQYQGPNTGQNNPNGSGGNQNTNGQNSQDNSQDNALANEPVAVNMPVPQSWSSIPGMLLQRGASELWWGPAGPQVAAAQNSGPGGKNKSNPVDMGLHGLLQNTFQGWVNSVPKGIQQQQLSTFLFGPPVPGGSSDGNPNGSDSGLTGLGDHGGLLGIIGIGLLGDGKRVKGLAGLLGEGIAFEMQPIEKAIGWNDSFAGSPAALWQAGNDFVDDATQMQMGAGQQGQPQPKKAATPKHGDPSTTGPNASRSNGGKPANHPNSTGTVPVSPEVDAYASQFGASPYLVQQVKQVATGYGWGSGAEWQALDTLIGNESSWNPNAQNPGSTAFGMGQFLDSTWSTVGATKTSDPTAQAQAMDAYIKQRYGDPIQALTFWNAQSPHWYSTGGDVWGEGTSTSDSIPAWLSDGEFVVNAQAANKHRDLLHAINSGMPGFDDGGDVDEGTRFATKAVGDWGNDLLSTFLPSGKVQAHSRWSNSTLAATKQDPGLSLMGMGSEMVGGAVGSLFPNVGAAIGEFGDDVVTDVDYYRAHQQNAQMQQMAKQPQVPTRQLVNSGNVTSHVDHSATYNVHAHDMDSSVKQLKLLEAQRMAKMGTYTGRWRNWRS